MYKKASKYLQNEFEASSDEEEADPTVKSKFQKMIEKDESSSEIEPERTVLTDDDFNVSEHKRAKATKGVSYSCSLCPEKELLTLAYVEQHLKSKEHLSRLAELDNSQNNKKKLHKNEPKKETNNKTNSKKESQKEIEKNSKKEANKKYLEKEQEKEKLKKEYKPSKRDIENEIEFSDELITLAQKRQRHPKALPFKRKNKKRKINEK